MVKPCSRMPKLVVCRTAMWTWNDVEPQNITHRVFFRNNCVKFKVCPSVFWGDVHFLTPFQKLFNCWLLGCWPTLYIELWTMNNPHCESLEAYHNSITNCDPTNQMKARQLWRQWTPPLSWLHQVHHIEFAQKQDTVPSSIHWWTTISLSSFSPWYKRFIKWPQQRHHWIFPQILTPNLRKNPMDYPHVIFCLVVQSPSWKIWVSQWGWDDIPYMKWKIKVMFETTNQYWLISHIHSYLMSNPRK